MSAAVKWAPPVVVGALTFACFSPSLENGFVNFDDPVAFLENPHIRSLSPAVVAWAFTTAFMATYQPFAWLLYALDYSVWGPDPAGFHLTALLLHTLNAVLAYFTLRELLRCTGAEDERVTAWASVAGALFYALHPLRVEPVVWISARGQLQAATFHLLTVFFYLRAHRDAERRRRWLGLSMGAFALCMLSKNHALALPLVLLVIDWVVLGRVDLAGAASAGGAKALVATGRRLVSEKLPYFAIAALAGVLAVLAKSVTGSTAMTGDIPHGPLERLLQAGYGLVFYLGKTLVPVGLSPLYPLERQVVEREPVFYVTAALVVGITLVCLALVRRAPGLLGAWLAYAILVAPVLGFTQSGPQIAADRYTYDPAMPWAALVGVALYSVAARSPRPARRALAAGVAVWLVALGALTARQTRVWRDSITLWTHALALHPQSGVIQLFYARTLREEGDYAAAVVGFTRALELGVPRPDDAYNARAASWHAAGDPAKALADMDRAIALAPGPTYYVNRGLMRRDAGDLQGAIADWTEAIRLDPMCADAYHNRGIALQTLGDRGGAAANYERALAAGLTGPARTDATRRLTTLRR